MHSIRKRRLIAIVSIIIGMAIAVSLMLYALNENINLFFTPSQIVKGEIPHHKDFRLGGVVLLGSVKRNQQSLQVQFAVTDHSNTVLVDYTGILPDLFNEGQGVVVQGHLNKKGVFEANEVLAKHDENYMPPQAAKAIKQPKKIKAGLG